MIGTTDIKGALFAEGVPPELADGLLARADTDPVARAVCSGIRAGYPVTVLLLDALLKTLESSDHIKRIALRALENVHTDVRILGGRDGKEPF